MKNENEGTRSTIHDLKERQKELNCLYEISKILKNNDESLEDLLKKVIVIIPRGYQFPEICRVQINVQGIVIQHDDLIVTELRQSSTIKVDEKVLGEINVYYIKPVKSEISGIFLHEEKKLIDAIADEIGQYIIINHYRNLLQSVKKKSEQFDIPIELSRWLSQWHLSDSQIFTILVNKVRFNSGELILKQDSQVSYSVILTRGLIKLSVGDLSSRSFIFKIVKPYDFIGLAISSSNAYWQYSASALINSEGYLVDTNKLNDFARDNNEFKDRLVNTYDKQINALYRKVNLLANKQTLGRLASTLIYLWEDIFDKQTIENSISRRTIAELSGMSTENAVRILSEFRNDGLINSSKSGIEIINSKMLRTFSMAG